MTDRIRCRWPDERCTCPECATPLGVWHGATEFSVARRDIDVPFNNLSDADDIEFMRAVAPFYDDTEPAIESANWDRED
jgi:hypothetical protein